MERIETILESLKDKVQRLLNVDRFYAVLYTDVSNKMEFFLLKDNTGMVQTDAWGPRFCNPKAFLPDWSLKQTRTLHFAFPEFEAELRGIGVAYWPNQPLPQAWLGAPMVIENRVVGLLVVENYRTPKAFGDTGKTILTNISRQTAIAIEHARLNERLQRKIKDLKAVNEIGKKLSASIELSEAEVIELINQQVKGLLDPHNMYIARYDTETHTVRFPLMLVNNEPVEVASRPAASEKQGRTEWIINTREPILIKTLAASKAWYDQPGRMEYIGIDFASWLGVPMIYQDRVIGVIAVYEDDEEFKYDEDDLEVLQALAGQAAVVFENIRIYESLEQATKKIAATQDMLTRTLIANDFVHRMRNLAGTIPIWTQLLREATIKAYEKTVDHLNDIDDDVFRLLGAADQLLTPPQEEPVNVALVIESIERQVNIQYENIVIAKEIEDNLYQVRAVPSLLANALWVIVENGIEAMPSGGMLTLRAYNAVTDTDEKFVRIEIADEGNGIPEETRCRIFEPYYTTKTHGHGYGLWSAKATVEGLGGTIRFTPGEDVGAIFIVSLPVKENLLNEKVN